MTMKNNDDRVNPKFIANTTFCIDLSAHMNPLIQVLQVPEQASSDRYDCVQFFKQKN